MQPVMLITGNCFLLLDLILIEIFSLQEIDNMYVVQSVCYTYDPDRVIIIENYGQQGFKMRLKLL